MEFMTSVGMVALIDTMPVTDLDLRVANAARVSYNNHETAFDDTKNEKLIAYLLNNGHTSPFEHVHFTFLVECPIYIARQWMRHRTWSFNEISRRYTDKGIVIYPITNLRTQDTKNKQSSLGIIDNFPINKIREIEEHFEYSQFLYRSLLDLGVSREQARAVLPQQTSTEFYATVDAHNLMHFLKLRMHPHSQLEIREYANAIFGMFSEKMPVTASVFKSVNKELFK